MNERCRATAALFLIAGLSWIAARPMPAVAAVPAPVADFVRDAEGRVRVSLADVDGVDGVDGYNVYRDGRYLTTVRPAPDVRSFTFPADGDGRYCLVAFRGRRGAIEYSGCGPQRIAAARSGGTPGTPAGTGATPEVVPAPVTDLRATRYSASAAELFWSASSDHAALVHYEVHRDGRLVASTRGRSHFDADVPVARAHVYEVIAIGRNGRRGAAARYRLGGSGAAGSGEPTVSLSPERPRLSEGAADFIDIALELRRDAAMRGRTLELSLQEARPGALRRIDHRFEPASLPPGVNRTRLRLRLGVDIAPILSGERHLQLVIDDGERRLERALIVDVVPVAADDVYLLIGQSNMEGYSEAGAKRSGDGEPDRPHERIRQLNVRPNSRGVFWSDAQFRDAEHNIAWPRFVIAEDPLHEPRNVALSGKGGTRIGAGLSFAKATLARSGRTVYLVPAAWSATGFCTNALGNIGWNAWPTGDGAFAGTQLADRALVRLNTTLAETGGILRGILWHQGGADADDARCVERYAGNLKRLVQRLRSEARVDARGSAARGGDAPVPFVLATQSRGSDERGGYSFWNGGRQSIDAMHRDVTSLLRHAEVVNNDDLVPPQWPCGAGSCVHFGAAALREQGRRFDAAIRDIARAAGQPLP